jgi:hypothetical protein
VDRKVRGWGRLQVALSILEEASEELAEAGIRPVYQVWRQLGYWALVMFYYFLVFCISFIRSNHGLVGVIRRLIFIVMLVINDILRRQMSLVLNYVRIHLTAMEGGIPRLHHTLLIRQHFILLWVCSLVDSYFSVQVTFALSVDIVIIVIELYFAFTNIELYFLISALMWILPFCFQASAIVYDCASTSDKVNTLYFKIQIYSETAQYLFCMSQNPKGIIMVCRHTNKIKETSFFI